jgi:hypothetical protein
MIYSKRGKTVEKHSLTKLGTAKKKLPTYPPKKTGVKENATN